MAIKYWITRPRMAVARLKYWIWERMNPEKPWLCPRTITFCELHLSSSMSALEFGSGRSTRWFSKLVGHLISIEHDPKWYEQIKQQLIQENITNVDYRMILLNHLESEPEQEEYKPVPDYVSVVDNLPDGSLDLAIVDGHYRTNCVRHLIPKIAPSGYLLVDDINLWASPLSLPVPKSWEILNDSTNGVKRCIIWQSP